MKIITDGRPKNKIYRAKCHKCGCEFEYIEKDTEFLPVALMADALVVRCPQEGCGKQQCHDDKNLVREEEVGFPILNQEEHEREQVREFLEWLSAKLDNAIFYEAPTFANQIRQKMAEMGLK